MVHHTSCASTDLYINTILKLISRTLFLSVFQVFLFYLYVCVCAHAMFLQVLSEVREVSDPWKLELQVIKSHLGFSEEVVNTPNYQVISPVPEPCFLYVEHKAVEDTYLLKILLRFCYGCSACMHHVHA